MQSRRCAGSVQQTSAPTRMSLRGIDEKRLAIWSADSFASRVELSCSISGRRRYHRAMKKKALRHVIVAMLIAVFGAALVVRAQQQGSLSAAEKTRRWDVENELQSIAVVERK